MLTEKRKKYLLARAMGHSQKSAGIIACVAKPSILEKRVLAEPEGVAYFNRVKEQFQNEIGDLGLIVLGKLKDELCKKNVSRDFLVSMYDRFKAAILESPAVIQNPTQINVGTSPEALTELSERLELLTKHLEPNVVSPPR